MVTGNWETRRKRYLCAPSSSLLCRFALHIIDFKGTMKLALILPGLARLRLLTARDEFRTSTQHHLFAGVVMRSNQIHRALSQGINRFEVCQLFPRA